jgi:outer membrane lipoprotein-sorting protein
MSGFASRRHLLLAALAVPLGGTAAAALPPEDAAAVAEVEAYLEGLRTLRARFEQLAPDGAVTTGTAYIQRPGRLRFAYDPPSRILLVAADWRLVFQDASVRQINVIPVRETPLSFLLAERVRLGQDLRVTHVERGGGEVALRIVRAAAPDQGAVLVHLAERPMALRRWSVTDAQGLTTQEILQDLEPNVALASELFVWRDPQLFGWPDP